AGMSPGPADHQRPTCAEIRPPQFPCISRAGRGAIAARGVALYGVRVGLPAPERIGPVAQWLEPTAHNGLVGGSNPPGPTIFNAFRVRTRFDRSRMFAFSSRISLVNRWSTWRHTSFGTRGSQVQIQHQSRQFPRQIHAHAPSIAVASSWRTPPSQPRRLVAVHRALYRSIVAARPHPRSPPWPDRHQENAAHHNAVLKHVVVLLVPSDRHGFEDQTGPSLEGQCFWVAPRTAVTLSAKKTVAKRPRPQPRQSMRKRATGQRAKEGRAFWLPFLKPRRWKGILGAS